MRQNLKLSPILGQNKHDLVNVAVTYNLTYTYPSSVAQSAVGISPVSVK